MIELWVSELNSHLKNIRLGHRTWILRIMSFLNKVPAFACFTYGIGGNGSKYQGMCDNRTKTLYVYNVEVFKRGKHHKNKHYDFYLYSIPMSLLNIVKMDIKQHHRNFTAKML